jgi:hypothetical protein
MKNYLILIAIAILPGMMISSCKDGCEKIICKNGGICDNGTCYCPEAYTGSECEISKVPVRVTFYNDNSSVGVITVTMSNTSRVIDYSIVPTACNQSGVANFEIMAGTYSYTANAVTGETWSGTKTFTQLCTIVELP